MIAIEALAHAGDLQAVLHGVRRHLAEDGLLIVVDDSLSRPEDALTASQQRLVRAFREGWRLHGLAPEQVFGERLRAAGFRNVQCRDLTPWIRTRRPRDWLVRACAPVTALPGLRTRPFSGNIRGGAALSRGLEQGLIRHLLWTADDRGADGQARSRPVCTTWPQSGPGQDAHPERPLPEAGPREGSGS